MAPDSDPPTVRLEDCPDIPDTLSPEEALQGIFELTRHQVISLHAWARLLNPENATFRHQFKADEAQERILQHTAYLRCILRKLELYLRNRGR